MTKPDGWEWLNGLPEEWRPPQELETPTSDPGANLAIRLLSDERLGHGVRVLLGQWIAERSLLTLWFMGDSGGEWVNLRREAELAILDADHQHAVYDAWTSRSGLAEALREAVRALAAARGEEPGTW
ncbi:hypothetical protein [Lentzea sp. NEAU-D7]|uniref:hypothetical protein n=1 Tax=Lentzea sp. NEAU-D7 TaxID=2994667 RepID=UPI00224B0D7C|nr:hypothetical protein [Lentzea sp. NEAU-D7]MCX2948407.1 hypothetical protein [Lentzea sp. NEAU-D7]